MVKPLNIIKIIFMASMFILSYGALADIVLPKRPVQLCVKISNLDEFPEIVLVALISKPRHIKQTTYQIQPGQCLYVGRKGSQTKIYWTTKEYMDSIKEKEIKDLLKSKDTRFHSLNISIPTWQEYMAPKKSILKKEQVFFLEYDSQHKLVLKKSKEVIKYLNGQPDNVKLFDKPSSASSNK